MCAYASLVGLCPSALSRWLNGRQPARRTDQRILSIGRLLGLEPAECFEVPVSEAIAGPAVEVA